MGALIGRFVYTVPEGEAYAITEWSGEVTNHYGPCRLPVSYQSRREIKRFVANGNEYLTIHKYDGTTTILPGPAEHWFNFVEDIRASSQQAIKIAEQELIVVYTRDDGNPPEGNAEVPLRGKGGVGGCEDERSASKDVLPEKEYSDPHVGTPMTKMPATAKAVRKIYTGPRIYMPQHANEWLQEFSWTGRAGRGASEEADCGRKRPNALQFTKLRTSPGKTYYDVCQVRTKDSATLTIKLMMFFQIVDVPTLLDNTNDPFADVYSSVSADIIEYFAPLTFEQALTRVDGLNDIATYPQLCKAVDKIGIVVEKVIFRGYSAPAALQRLHDSAIETRTNLALAAERLTEEERQEDVRLKAKTRRAEEEFALQTKKLKVDIECTQAKELSNLEGIEKKNVVLLKHEEAMMSAKAEHQMRLDALEIKRLKKIMEMDGSMKLQEYLSIKDSPLRSTIQCANLLHDSASTASNHSFTKIGETR